MNLRKDHELSVPELLAKIENLIALVRVKSYGEGFEEGRAFEIDAKERDDNEMW